jgi:hypothetical protein
MPSSPAAKNPACKFGGVIMNQALIICDDLNLGYLVESQLAAAGWASNSITVTEMILHRLVSVSHYQCVILVVDKEFRARHGNVVFEIKEVLRNGANKNSIYMLFEGDYDQYFSPLLACTKRLFKSLSKPQSLKASIDELVRLEIEPTPMTAFVSPMSGV